MVSWAFPVPMTTFEYYDGLQLIGRIRAWGTTIQFPSDSYAFYGGPEYPLNRWVRTHLFAPE